jgi:hypothetical protein
MSAKGRNVSTQAKYPWPTEDHPSATLETAIGSPRIRALGHSIMVDGGTPHNTPDGEAGELVIRGVRYSVNGHFHLWSDGAWHSGSEADNWNASRGYDYREPHLSRKDYNANKGYAANEPSEAAVRKAREVLTAAVNRWATENPEALVAGERVHRAQDAHQLAGQVDRCQAALDAVSANLKACESGRPYKLFPLKSIPEVER